MDSSYNHVPTNLPKETASVNKALPKDLLVRKLERERLARLQTEKVLEQRSLELYQAHQSTLKTLSQEHNLFEQYKVAVDLSSIVSKADCQGNINYVNEAFCRISGFTEAELLGQPHSIVRHPQTPKWIFSEMWQTIASKRVWRGTFKNQTKSGKSYYVDTTIMPILNEHGKIEEYISIRHDITDTVMLQKEILETQKEIVLTLSEVSETRSKETGHHVKRVAEYSYRLALLAGLSDTEAEIILTASPMHDIGKIGIPDHILLKPGKLSADEFEVMKQHAEKGYEVFAKSNRPILKAAAIIAYQHHERWDGEGYPRGLQGECIHLYGRITAIADVFDALINKRCYKPAWPVDKIRDYFEQQKGKQFDPQLTQLFLDQFEDFLDIFQRWKG